VVELWSPYYGQLLFGGRRTYLWLLADFLYAGYAAVFTPSQYFSSTHLAWFFNPHVDYADDLASEYNNSFNTVHVIGIAVAMPTLYLFFVARLRLSAALPFFTSIERQKMAVTQVLIMSALNAVMSCSYCYMQNFPVSEFVIYLASYGWLLVHGLPSLIYLTANATLRRDIVRMVKCTKEPHGVMEFPVHAPMCPPSNIHFHQPVTVAFVAPAKCGSI